MQFLLFIFYSILFVSILHVYNYKKNTGLTLNVIAGLYFLKVIGGCINLYVHKHTVITNDVTFYFSQSIKELSEMKNNPAVFFNEWLFNWGDISNKFNLFKKENMTFWSSLGMLIHSKYMTLANIFSLGNEYVNVLFYNFIYFTGQLALYKSLYLTQPHKKYLFIGAVFFIPSVIFWCSGIHKDGIVLSAIGYVCYYGVLFVEKKQIRFLIYSLLACVLLFVTRYFYLLILAPAFLLWQTFKNKHKAVYIYLAVYVIGLLLFFNIHKLFPTINPMNLISNRQLEFLSLRGYSDMSTPILHNTFESYIQNFPTALYHIFLKPDFSFLAPLKYQLAAIDGYLILAIILVCIMFVKRQNFQFGLLLFLMFFGITAYVFIGYTIPNAGAMVRYKSEFTTLLIASLVGLSEVPFLKKFYSK